MTPVLVAERICVRRGGIALLTDVSLTLREGRISVLVGPNGAGKSTLLKVLAGELSPDDGHVTLNSTLLGRIPPWRLACARAVLPQSVAIGLPFTVREIVRLGCEGIGRNLGRAERDALVEAALASADVAGLAERVVHRLSGGERQRVHFARVLCQLAAGRAIEPKQVLLLDEPVASLDLRHQVALLDHASALAKTGTAVFVILHDLNLAAAYADELVVLDRGRIAAQGAPETVLTDPCLRDTFGLALRIGETPPSPMPFVLPIRR